MTVGHRRKTSLADELLDFSSHLPWQAGLGLAVVAFAALHYYASRAPLPVNPQDLQAPGKTIGDVATATIIQTVTGVLQYLIPAVLLVGAGISFLRRRQRAELHDQVAADADRDALEKISWLDFEGLVADTFLRKGFRVTERGGAGPDGGIDLLAYRGKDKYLVQCKQWKAHQVDVAAVRELYGVMTAEHAVGGFVVSSGSFTVDAKKFAEGRSIELVDARQLRAMIGRPASAAADDDDDDEPVPVAPRRAARPAVAPQPAASRPRPAAPPPAAGSEPVCPKCGAGMVLRTAKAGSHAGKQFWGCSRFPDCRGIVSS